MGSAGLSGFAIGCWESAGNLSKEISWDNFGEKSEKFRQESEKL